MLRKLNRDDSKSHKPQHPNKIKNTAHNFNVGCSDFPSDRQNSTKTFFYGKKDRIENNSVALRSNHSQIQIGQSKNGYGFDSSMTRNDFAPYKFTSTQKDQPIESKNFSSSIYKSSNPKHAFGYPSAFKTSNSLLQRDRDAVNRVDKVKPPKNKAELLKTQFEISTDKEFTLKSNYGETYTGATTSQLPVIGYRHNMRDYNIVTNDSKPLHASGWPRDKYERFDCRISNHRQSNNYCDLRETSMRIDPSTGRHIG